VPPARNRSATPIAHLGERIAANDWILVHDAARPCIVKELVEQFLDEIGDDPVGGLLAMPLTDTIKSADENQRVAATVRRAGLWRAQTPQMFRAGLLRRGLEAKARRDRRGAGDRGGGPQRPASSCRARTATSRSPSPRTSSSPR
jgi:2-C-methyl-D-erythritol 4-phosphate cytidylyltransferase